MESCHPHTSKECDGTLVAPPVRHHDYEARPNKLKSLQSCNRAAKEIIRAILEDRFLKGVLHVWDQ